VLRCACFQQPPTSTATSPLSLHDALPICITVFNRIHKYTDGREVKNLINILILCHHFLIYGIKMLWSSIDITFDTCTLQFADDRSEEHTSELQSRENLVCRLLLDKEIRTY